MNFGESSIINNEENLIKIIADSINNIKEKNYKKSIELLLSSKELINKIIAEITESNKENSKENKNKIISRELLSQFLFFKEINKYIEDSNALFRIKSLLNNILNIIFEEKNFEYICDQSLVKECINNCLNIIYLNSKSKLIFILLVKKIDNYIQYIISIYPSYKDEILNSRNSFKNYHSKSFLNYKKEFEDMDIYNLSKSEEIKDKNKSLLLLTKFFNNFEYFNEKYEFLNIISKELFPSLLNLKLPELTHKKNTKIIELYINIGKFLLKFLFNKNYMFDFSPFNTPKGSDESTPDEEKFLCVFLYDKSEIKNLDELNGNTYIISYQYEIIKEYYKEIMDIMINYFIKPFMIYDTNFDLQLIIFKLLKYLYFILKDKNENEKNKLIKYIPEVLNNLSYFKKEEEFEEALESREFGYYLLLKDSLFKYEIKSLTNAPENETEVYTTKIDISRSVLNNFFEKKEIIKGKGFSLLTQINKKNSIIYIEFYVENCSDITVTVYKKSEKENNFEQIGFSNVITTVKNESNGNEIEDSYKIAKIIIVNSSTNNDGYENDYLNVFKIVFDNYDSWFTNKILYYSISSFEIKDK